MDAILNVWAELHIWIITGLIAVIGYFLKNWEKERKEKEKEILQKQSVMLDLINQNKAELTERTDSMFTKSIEKFTEVADRLDKTITNLEKIVGIMEQKNIDFARRIEEKEKKLDKHEKTINAHSVRLERIETGCRLNHGRK